MWSDQLVVTLLTSAFRTTPSAPVYKRMTKPRRHWFLEILGSHINTTSPSFIGLIGSHHLTLLVRVGKYSNTHLFQNLSLKHHTMSHFFFILNILSSGTLTKEVWTILSAPRRKWIGKWVNGLDLDIFRFDE